MIDTSWLWHGLGSRVIITLSAVPQLSQSAPHVVDAITLLDPHVL